MKIIRRSINFKSGEGFIVLQAEEDEDMYQLYNMINKDDLVEAMTTRNVITESKTGARDKVRVQTKITIQVNKIEFDAEQCSLRLNGINVRENDNIKMGQYHTLEIELNRPFTIIKENWDSIHMEQIQDLCDPIKKSEVAALVMQEGLANLCLIKNTVTRTCARIERNLPKKKHGNNIYEKALERFFDDLYNAIMLHIDFDVIKVLLVGSPGFLNEDFITYAISKSIRENESSSKALHKNKSKLLKVHSSSGYKSAIEEILGSNEIVTNLNDVKVIDEVKALKEFYDILSTDPERACYGLNHVLMANEQVAIDYLLISDKMYRCSDFVQRKKFVELIESVKNNRGKVYKFSSLHVSGEQLDNFTGIAATLRFPIPNLDELVEEKISN